MRKTQRDVRYNYVFSLQKQSARLSLYFIGKFVMFETKSLNRGHARTMPSLHARLSLVSVGNFDRHSFHRLLGFPGRLQPKQNTYIVGSCCSR
jgi:hypothetical protein